MFPSPLVHEDCKLLDAIRQNHPSLVRSLLIQMSTKSTSANDSHKIRLLQKAFLLAAESGNIYIMGLLLENNLQCNRFSYERLLNEALHTSAHNNHPKAVSYLLGKGADVDAKNEDYETALHLCARHGFYSIIVILLQARADPCTSNPTPLDLAQSYHHSNCVDLLREYQSIWRRHVHALLLNIACSPASRLFILPSSIVSHNLVEALGGLYQPHERQLLLLKTEDSIRSKVDQFFHDDDFFSLFSPKTKSEKLPKMTTARRVLLPRICKASVRNTSKRKSLENSNSWKYLRKRQTQLLKDSFENFDS